MLLADHAALQPGLRGDHFRCFAQDSQMYRLRRSAKFRQQINPSSYNWVAGSEACLRIQRRSLVSAMVVAFYQPLMVPQLRRTQFSLLTIALAVSALPIPSLAAEKDDSAYRDLVKKVTGGDLLIDFRALRLACLKASSCDARGDLENVTSMHVFLHEKQYDKAAKAADALIEKGFVNIEAHVISSQAYMALNQPEKAQFHHDVAAGLLHSILSTGDGKTKESAFEVIGTFEEHVVMAVLGLPPLGPQALIPGKPHSYDILKVKDPKTGQEVSVYFNIDAFYPPKGL
jgi:hypothetical protein